MSDRSVLGEDIQTPRRRKRLPLYLVSAAATIGLGLGSRSSYAPETGVLRTYAGDTLWALLVVLLVCMLRPRWQSKTIVLSALAFAFMIEASQLYHAPWIDAVRASRLGGLVLGYGFKFSDLICYSVGVGIGAIADLALRRPGMKG